MSQSRGQNTDLTRNTDLDRGRTLIPERKWDLTQRHPGRVCSTTRTSRTYLSEGGKKTRKGTGVGEGVGGMTELSYGSKDLCISPSQVLGSVQVHQVSQTPCVLSIPVLQPSPHHFLPRQSQQPPHWPHSSSFATGSLNVPLQSD